MNAADRFRAFFSRFAQGASAKTVWGSMRAEQVPSRAARWMRPRSDPECRKRRSDTGKITEKCSSGAPSAYPVSVRQSALAARHLQKRFGARTVVKDISLEVKSGEIVRLLGPNGAGKTTSFYMMVGLITLDGHPVSMLPIHRRALLGLSYLPQESSVFRKLSVEQNIRAVLELQRDARGVPLPANAIAARTQALMNEFHIAHLNEHIALSLSGGERRRVEIARALATNPKFILLDEPFSGVDPIAVLEIQKIIRFLKRRNIGILVTDHNVRETLGICDHAYIVSDGRVLAAGAPSDIIANESVRRVYLGEHFKM